MKRAPNPPPNQSPIPEAADATEMQAAPPQAQGSEPFTLAPFGHADGRVRFTLVHGRVAGPAGNVSRINDPRWVRMGRAAWEKLAGKQKMLVDDGKRQTVVPSSTPQYPISAGDNVSAVLAEPHGPFAKTFAILTGNRGLALVADVNHTRGRARLHDKLIESAAPGWFAPAAWASLLLIPLITLTLLGLSVGRQYLGAANGDDAMYHAGAAMFAVDPAPPNDPHQPTTQRQDDETYVWGAEKEYDDTPVIRSDATRQTYADDRASLLLGAAFSAGAVAFCALIFLTYVRRRRYIRRLRTHLADTIAPSRQ